MQPVARAHDRIRATFALVLGATTVLAGAVGRVLHAGPWPTELVVSALALALTSLLALVVVWPRAGQAASLGVLPLAALLGVVMMVWALAVPEQGPRLWPAAVAAAGGATTLAAFARWTLASGAHVLPRLALTPSDRYAVAKGGQGKAKMSAAGTIAPGDRVEVPAGQRVPTDGVVREGSGFADERSLTAAELADHPKFAGKFAEVDTDKDGKLSTAELTAFKARRHEDRGERGRHGERGPRGEQRGEAQL